MEFETGTFCMSMSMCTYYQGRLHLGSMQSF